MDDLKKGYREAEETTKEAWRNRDGEDLADKVGNVGDDITKHLGNLGDDTREAIDKAGDTVDDAVDDARTGADRQM
jgi:hypothetical protein